MLVNRLNFFAATNILARLATVFGVLVFLGYSEGVDASSRWVVLTTYLASINTLDGLLSQYFMRKFIIYKCSTHEIVRFQNKVYLFLSIVFSVLFLVLIDFSIVGATLAGLYVFVKRLDSRARAFANTEIVFKLESVSNLFVFSGLIFIVLSQKLDYLWLNEIYLLLLCAVAMVRNVFISKNEVFKAVLLTKFNFDGEFKKENKVVELKNIIVMSSSGALSINLSLLIINAFFGDEIECISLMLSYRVFMLICEIASIPLVSRVPVITQLVSSNRLADAEKLFNSNRALSLMVLIGGFVSFIVIEMVMRNSLPVALDFSSTYVLVIIAMGWLVERIISYQVLFDLCHSEYGFGRVLAYYIPMMLVVLCIVLWFSMPMFFPAFVLLINVITISAKRLNQ